MNLVRLKFGAAALVMAIATSLGLSGCGKSEEQVRAELAASAAAEAASKAAAQAVSFASMEVALQTARENSMTNAQEYRSLNPELEGFELIPNGDSTQSNECPQGDGWATIKLTKKNADGSRTTTKLKCSTVSAGLSCLPEDVFKTKVYAKDEGKCQPTTKVPYPLPRIGGK